VFIFFFLPHVTDKRLETVIDPNIAWKYLLANNREDMLLTWISAYYSRLEESVDVITGSSGTNCTDQDTSDESSEEVQIRRLFSRWDVTQSVIDDIYVVCCMTRTKEIVLDHLSR
jgi:hypothetical protein